MAEKFPRDEFDAAPEHGGRHRVRRTAMHRVREFLKITVISAAVAVLGFAGLKAVDSLNFFDATQLPATTIQQEKLKPIVVVLDGTSQDGLASKWAATLASSYNVASAANYVPASGGQVTASMVYYSDEANATLARAIAKKILTKTGAAAAVKSSEFSDAVTVILGTDLQ